jgi:hypothetical protein
MQTVTLSDAALALLKLRARTYPVKGEDHAPAAYHELVEAGLMGLAPKLAVQPGFRLTEEGWRLAHSLAAAEYLPHLSARSLYLLQFHLAAIGLGNGGTSGTPSHETRESYRELAKAGLMGACHTFAGGPESLYRLTEVAYEWRVELLGLKPSAHRRRSSPSAILRKMRRAVSLIGSAVSATRLTT